MRLINLDAVAAFHVDGKIYDPADVRITSRPSSGITITVTYARNARGGFEPGVVRFDGCEWEIQDGLLWLTNDREAVCIPLVNVRDIRLSGTKVKLGTGPDA